MSKDEVDLLSPDREPVDLLGALVDLPRDRLAQFRPQLRTLLKHRDADVRATAFRRLLVHLRDHEHHSEAVEALRYDPDTNVRRVAAFGIAATTSDGTRKTDVRELADVVCDRGEATAVRGAAYEALLLMHGRTDLPPVKEDIDLVGDIDWKWVRSLRADT